ncbi:MAG: rhamnosyltransferase [Burkholderiales bacterium]|nr:rhamnosyltransferase [Burkholderiales bacterium]
MNTVDVIIPIYNAFEDVVRCIDRVRRHTASDCRIVLIDDCSPDERIAALFATLEAEADARIVLLKNSSNMGFVNTVNRGMSSTSNDVVLLNSDTIVTTRWLEKVRICAASDRSIGTITPFSNNAEICSFPVFCQNNSLAGVDIEVVSRAMEETATPAYPDIPTAVGFCMFIRRSLLDAIGLFDAETFGLGYGEENDFCMRAIHAGYRNVLCDDTFVAHIGSRSFSAKAVALKKRNLQLLLDKHPQYLNLVQRFIADDPLAPIRARAQARLANKPATHQPCVASITVTFNPAPMRLAEQIVALGTQVDEIFIVDNGSAPSVKSLFARPEIVALVGEDLHINFIVLEENQGLASGFNIGMDASRMSGAEFGLLLDQDSIPAADMVTRLLAGYQRVASESAASAVAAVGPRIVDSRDKLDYPFTRLGWLDNQHLRCTSGQQKTIACDFLISSGALIPISAFDKIGKFDDALFIDSVDLEWCCRARARQFSLYGVCDAELDHRLGDERRVILKQINLVVHTPLRIYYMTRNRIRLYRYPHMPMKWKLKDMLRMAAKFVALMLFVAPRMEYLRMTFLAVRDAVAHRGGRFQDHR